MLGDPVEHSLSPVIFARLFESCHMDAEYGKILLPRGSAGELRALMLERGLDGVNLTMPHKLDVLPYLDEAETFARLCGSVNTVCMRNGRLLGYSTDAQGFFASLDEAGIGYAGRDVLILGAGGAARAVAVGAAKAGARSVSIASRTVQRGRETTELISGCFRIRTAFSGFSITELSALCERCDLLVNTTPLGMDGVREDFREFSFLDRLKPGVPVCDLIYRPGRTSFLRYAEEAGHPVINGLGMLIFQAFAAFERFTGVKPGADLAETVRQSLVLQL